MYVFTRTPFAPAYTGAAAFTLLHLRVDPDIYIYVYIYLCICISLCLDIPRMNPSGR